MVYQVVDMVARWALGESARKDINPEFRKALSDLAKAAYALQSFL